MNATERLSLAAVVAALVAGVPLAPLTQDRTYLILALLLMVLSAVLGGGLRRVRAPEIVVRLAQLAPVLLVPWLVPETQNPVQLYLDTVEYVAVAFAPMPYQAGFAVFCALLVWTVYLFTDTLATTLASPAWTFPVLVMPYAIPSIAIYAETSPFLFFFVAGAYALILATATSVSVVAPSGTDEVTTSGWRHGVAATAALSTAIALTATVLVTLPIAERSGNGVQPGGTGSVQLGDPTVDLIRNVNSNSSQVLITYETSDGAGQYLRLAALPVFDDTGFHLSRTDLVPLQFDRPRPSVADDPPVRTSVHIGNLASEYLPMPWFPLTAVTSSGNWRYDPETLSVVAVGDGRTSATRSLSYETTSVRMPSAESLLPRLRTVGDPNDQGQTLQLPDGLSADVRALAERVTRDKETPGAKALALLNFLHSDAFTYSTAVSPGTTLGTLDDFLLGSRIGYCEQFAGSMAVLARVVGIPSRVVVGFLPGRKAEDGWEVSARYMHAWTELYFGEGIGWVPVDPTPAGGTTAPTTSASASPTHSATTPTVTAQPSTVAPTTAAAAPEAGGGPGAGGAWGWALGGAVALLLVGVGPSLARAALRRFRLAGSADPGRAAERAWDEVRAVATDRGRSWPRGTTRQVVSAFGPDLGPEGARALAELALVVERTRYDGEPVAANDLAAGVRTITRAFEERWTAPAAGRWWPRSVRPQTSS
jgi:transglutaminase-like putative cysteine protease